MINLTPVTRWFLLKVGDQVSVIVATLGEYMRSSGEAAEYWPLQILLDTYAAAQNVPLRCLNVGRLRALHQRDDKFSAVIRKHFPTETAFHTEIAAIAHSTEDGLRRLREHEEAWHEILGEDVFEYWIVLPSHSSPLAVLLRESRHWAWWETIWCIQQGLTVASEPTERLRAPLTYRGPLGSHIHLADLYVPAVNIIVFAGPVWLPWPLGTSEGQRIRDAEEALQAFLQSADGTVHRDLNATISMDRLLRHVRHRAPVDLGDLRLRLQQIGDALDHALMTEIEGELPAVHVEALAISTLFQRCRRVGVHPARNARRWSILYPLPGLDRDPDDPRPTLKRWHRSDWQLEDQHWHLTATCLTDEVGQDDSDTLVLRLENEHAGVPDGQVMQEPALSRFLSDLTTNRNAYLLERLSLMRLWLQSTFLELSTEAKPEEVGTALGRLARRLVQMLGADGCSFYRYDAKERTLRRFACCFTYETEETLNRTADLMRDAGRDPLVRGQCASYQAIDDPDQELVFLRSVRAEATLVVDQKHPPRCLLAVPIVVHDRAWGVMEIKALQPYQLSESSVRWAKEIVRLVGPYFYERWLLEKLHDIDKIAATSQYQPRQKLDLILHRFADLLMASSAALYLRHPRRTSEYDCVASFGRPSEAGFEANDEHSLSAKMLREGRDFETGKIGDAPFAGTWLDRPKAQRLQNGEHRYIALITIRDSDDRPFGSITVTSREPYPFSPSWRNHILYFARHIGIHIEAVQARIHKEDETREYMAHAVKNRVDRVLGAVERVDQALGRFFGEAGDAERVVEFLRGVEILASRAKIPLSQVSTDAINVMAALRQLFARKDSIGFEHMLADLRTHAADLRVSAVYLSGGANVEDPWNADPKMWNGTWARLRACLLSAIKPKETIPGRLVMPVPPVQELSSSLQVRMPSVVLIDILSNLVDNALKYNFDAEPPRVRFLSTDREATLDIRNLAPRPSAEEERMLGERDFRATYARQRAEGTGRGLSMSYAAARKWGLELDYDRPPAERRSGDLVWHRVRLRFPAASLRRGSF